LGKHQEKWKTAKKSWNTEEWKQTNEERPTDLLEQQLTKLFVGGCGQFVGCLVVNFAVNRHWLIIDNCVMHLLAYF